MQTKTCILCFEEKAITEYYKHPRMTLGVDSKCKECVKKRAQERHHRLMEDPEFHEKERVRHREKYHRLEYKEQQKEWDAKKPWKQEQIYKNLSRKLKLETGTEAHHWSYEIENLEDIFVLSNREHKQLHRYLTLNIETRNFTTDEGVILDTKQKHKEFIESKGFSIIKNEYTETKATHI